MEGATCSNSGNRNNSKQTISDLGIVLEKPKHQQFAIKSVREDTFAEWPGQLRQRPKHLAEAGFFYGGSGDVVFCFYCGQGLQEWAEDDLPWVEHAQWSPNCAFVKNVKGRAFVAVVVNRNYNVQEYQALVQNERESKRRTTATINDGSSASISLFMRTIAVQSLLVNGYTQTNVNLALRIWLERHSNASEPKAAELMDILFDIEDGKIGSVVGRFEGLQLTEANRKEQEDQQRCLELNKANKEMKQKTTCCICKEEMVSVVCLPCTHLCFCEHCSPAFKHCPVCKEFIKGTVKVYLV